MEHEDALHVCREAVRVPDARLATEGACQCSQLALLSNDSK